MRATLPHADRVEAVWGGVLGGAPWPGQADSVRQRDLLRTWPAPV